MNSWWGQMNVTFRHANPWDGRESYLVRFTDEILDQTTCLLVDAGAGVDVDELLADEEYLSGILLTHAHLDHYQTLGENLRDQAPIYATPETVATIEAILETDDEHVSLANPEAVREALTPISEWEAITQDIRVHSVPAGHAPGAAGFLIQFSDGSEQHHILATGDFTTQRIAGYPGFTSDLPVDVETVFLTAATEPDTVEERLTETIETIRERARAGSTVLTTASSLTGIHLAYLLGHLNDASDLSLPVRLVGRAATLWEAFGYDHPTVTAVPEFTDPETVLTPGEITIAGPEVPIAGSAERLFDFLATDAGATLVQVTSGAFDSYTDADARGTVYDYQVSSHPTAETIDDVVEAIDPIHVVVTHQQGSAADRYKDKYDSFVWATDDQKRYTLYDDGEWTGPPWVTAGTRRRVLGRQYIGGTQRLGDSFDTDEVPIPAVTRHEDCDLTAEGLDLDRLVDVDSTSDRQIGQEASDSQPAAMEQSEDTSGLPGASTPETGARGNGQSRTSEPDGRAFPSEAKPADSESVLQDIREQLTRIETSVSRARIRARVIDAGDGVTLFRPLDETVASDLSHGQVVELALADAADDATPEQTGEENNC